MLGRFVRFARRAGLVLIAAFCPILGGDDRVVGSVSFILYTKNDETKRSAKIFSGLCPVHWWAAAGAIALDAVVAANAMGAANALSAAHQRAGHKHEKYF